MSERDHSSLGASAPARGSPTERKPSSVAPVRVVLSRRKGWKMPPNTVKVDRTTVFGNPYTVEDCGRHDAVEHFRSYMTAPLWEDPEVRRQQMIVRAKLPGLRGKNLACWCRLDRACHADVLLALANAPVVAEGHGEGGGAAGSEVRADQKAVP